VGCWLWEKPPRRGGDLRRFDTQPHLFYCGIDLHARSMYVCILKQDGEIVTPRNMKIDLDALRKGLAPYRAELVIAVEGVFTWDLAGRPLRSRGHFRRTGPGLDHAGVYMGVCRLLQAHTRKRMHYAYSPQWIMEGSRRA
jgi:hypothetical protein